MQATIKQKVTFEGVGLHSGAAVSLTILPAPADHGIVFLRADMGVEATIAARWDLVTPSRLCTLLDDGQGVTLSTVEHIMAALAGTGLTNALVEVSGPEVPILDGSSAPFVRGILRAGIELQANPVRAIRVLRPVELREGDAFARFTPADHLQIDFHIDFVDRAIGVQKMRLDMANGAFLRELADSRTFCRQSDVDAMRKSGLALGGTYLNAVVVDDDQILTPGGLRHQNEAVRHKMLDAMGDLALAGAPLLARYTGHRAGHAMTNRLLRKLFADVSAWEWTTCTADQESRLPGAGVAFYGAAAGIGALAV